GGDADQGRDLSAFDLPQFGQERDQGGGSDRPDARDGTQLGRSLAVGLGDGLGDGLVQQDDFRLQPAQLALQAGHDQRLAMTSGWPCTCCSRRRSSSRCCTTWPRRWTKACNRCCCGVSCGVGGVSVTCARGASSAASIGSVLAVRPMAIANDRARCGGTRTTGHSGCRAAMTARSYPPVASSSTRSTGSLRRRRASARWPSGLLATSKTSPAGRSATASVALATSIPTNTDIGFSPKLDWRALLLAHACAVRAADSFNCSGLARG